MDFGTEGRAAWWNTVSAPANWFRSRVHVRHAALDHRQAPSCSVGQSGQVLPVSGAEIVDDLDVVPRSQQAADQVGTDEAGAAGDNMKRHEPLHLEKRDILSKSLPMRHPSRNFI